MDDDAGAPGEAGPEAAGEQPSDDLKRIRRISREAERRLHAAGVRTFAVLALKSPDEIAEIVSLPSDRIMKENWIGQAGRLTEQPLSAGGEQPEVPSGKRFPHETFTIRLSMDDNNLVTHTTVTRVRSNRVESWAGWETERLLEFLSDYVNLSVGEGAAGTVPPPAEPEPVPVAGDAAPPPGDTQAEVPAVPEPKGQPAPPPPTPAGELRLRELEVVSLASGQSQRLLGEDEPFAVRLLLDPQETVVPGGEPLEFTAVVFAKRFDGGHGRTAGKGAGMLVGTEAAVVEVRSDGLPRGLYRLEVTMRLRDPASGQPPRLLSAGGGTLEVD